MLPSQSYPESPGAPSLPAYGGRNSTGVQVLLYPSPAQLLILHPRILPGRLREPQPKEHLLYPLSPFQLPHRAGIPHDLGGDPLFGVVTTFLSQKAMCGTTAQSG